MGIAVSSIILLLALMWFFLLRAGPAKDKQTESSDDGNTSVIEATGTPFALIPELIHGDDDAAAIASIIAQTLAAQKAYVLADTDGLPARARDNFSIAYIGGYVDAVLRRKRITTMRTRFTIGELVFVDVFGRADGFSFYEKYISLQHGSDSVVFAGMAAGESDIEEWFKNNLNAPFGWSVYVHSSTRSA